MKKQYTVLHHDQEMTVEIDPQDDGFQIKLGDTSHHFKVLHHTQTLCTFLVDESQILEADTKFRQDKCELNIRNVPYHLEVFDPKRRMISQSELTGGGGLIAAPMPGKIVEIKVKVGDAVEKGQALVVIEAMKMQNELPAPLTGIVQEVSVGAGDAVEADQKLVVVAPE